MTDQRPYATLLAKGEDRRQRIIAVALRLLARNGWRSTTLGQIAREAGVTPAGILHHFESKEHLLGAVLDARDSYDNDRADLWGHLPEQIAKVLDRYEQAPDLIGMFTVLLAENLSPDAPLHDRLLDRYRSSVEIVATAIRRGQRAGEYRTDIDPGVKAVEIIAVINGMETSWLLDPSIPLARVFRGYAEAVDLQLSVPSGSR